MFNVPRIQRQSVAVKDHVIRPRPTVESNDRAANRELVIPGAASDHIKVSEVADDIVPVAAADGQCRSRH